MSFSRVSWTHYAFNLWLGCCANSPGCKNCYARRDYASRWKARFGVEFTKTGHRHPTSEATWRAPLSWERQAARLGTRFKVFVEDMGDLFEGRSDLDALRARFWNLVGQCPHLDWQLCTKRIENVRKMVPAEWLEQWPSNVHLGVTVEDQAHAAKRIPLLLGIPAQVRYLSVEPLLEKVDLTEWLGDLQWVICGGESCGRAKPSSVRPFDPEWARSLRDQCRAFGVPFFFMRWGDNCSISSVDHRIVLGKPEPHNLPVLDGRCWDEFPGQVGGQLTEPKDSQMKTQIRKLVDEFAGKLVVLINGAPSEAQVQRSVGRAMRSKPRGLAALSPEARSEVAKKAAATRKHRAAGKKAAATRKSRAQSSQGNGNGNGHKDGLTPELVRFLRSTKGKPFLTTDVVAKGVAKMTVAGQVATRVRKGHLRKLDDGRYQPTNHFWS